LVSVSKLNEFSATILNELLRQKEYGNQVETKFKNLNILSEEISSGMDEEKIALQEASIAAEHNSKISEQLKEVAQRLEGDFKKFKTE